MKKEQMSAKGAVSTSGWRSAFGGKKTFLSSLGLSLFLGGLVFVTPFTARADYPAQTCGAIDFTWPIDIFPESPNRYPLPGYSSPTFFNNSYEIFPDGAYCGSQTCSPLFGMYNFDTSANSIYGFAPNVAGGAYGAGFSSAVSMPGLIPYELTNRTLDVQNSSNWYDVTTYIAPTPGSYGGTPCCNSGDTLSADKKTCVTVVVPPAICPPITLTAPTQNYSCPNGETLSGSTCEYAPTLSGGIFDRYVCSVEFSSIYFRPKWGVGTAPNECVPGTVIYLSSSNMGGNMINGERSVDDGNDIDSAYFPNMPIGLGGYLSPTPIAGSENYAVSAFYHNAFALWSIGRRPDSASAILSIGGGVELFGYTQSSPGTQPTLSCKAGDTLSADKTKCTHPATPTYACSNVCSDKFSYTQEAYISNDTNCISRADANTTFSLNANCGAKLFPAPAPLDSSSLTPCIQVADGACGAAKDVPTASIPTTSLCALYGGNASPVIDSGTKWDWTCIGSSTTAPCSASKSCTPTYDNYICTSMEISCDASNAGKTIISKTPVCVRNVANGCNQGVTQPSPQECIDNGALCPAQESKLCPAAREIKSWQEVAPS